ncbi:TetR/AcrR family transcriptional regulator [Streptomyces sp. FIT100]|uniref:TetR/AcrR family transcriptional regulator n=1 Tax=Streptomyces sp. FIT100 TaxID=2837956 RepID=UPI0021CA2893|nr:TetR/AcrR family transcriptional regulator [Streptomyces sp. FIT100]UUN29669.1 TetR/AcrR family transcriptional regulator [Streptomyces sp. FIT100]
MPKLWNETIEAHRGAVREAVLDTAAALVAEGGLLSVTMSRLAQEAGIGRATLYKYFPDVESVLVAWHERRVTDHLAQLEAVRDRLTGPGERLQGVLEAYALMTYERHEHHGTDMAALLHQGAGIAHAHQRLLELVTGLVAEGAKSGALRDDVASGELAAYCLHALGGAAGLPSKAAVRRLVAVTVAGLLPPAQPVEAATPEHGPHRPHRHGSH